jgi:hypothetical protein
MNEHGHVLMFRLLYEHAFSGLEEGKTILSLTVRL